MALDYDSSHRLMKSLKMKSCLGHVVLDCLVRQH